MINVSLEHVRTVYIIPRPLYNRSTFKTEDDYYQAIETGAIQGLNVDY